MRTLIRALSVLLLATTATSASAQPGGPGGSGRRGPGPTSGGMGRGAAAGAVGATADFLLAHTGDLALTDAQVVRLAAISRRTEARRKTMAARMDSVRAADRPARDDSAADRGRRGPDGPPPAEPQQMRDQVRSDVRDAISVLTADQQASAWMMIAGGPALGAGRRGPGGPGGPGRDDAVGPPADRGAISRPPAARDVPGRPEDADRPTL